MDLNKVQLLQTSVPQPQARHILDFAHGLAALKQAGVFTAAEIRAWVINGVLPLEKLPEELKTAASKFGKPFED